MHGDPEKALLLQYLYGLQQDLALTALLLLISGGNIMLFVGATFWTNFLEGIINRITFIVFVLLFKP